MSTRTSETPIGALTLTASADAVTAVRFGAQGARDASALLDAAEAQLHEYFARTRRTFDLPLDPRGTAFELRVWAALRTIPYGETRSYGAIAAAIGSPRAARAVGMANHRNPLPILIPCHRVIGADGSLTGYAGGLETKRRLLDAGLLVQQGEGSVTIENSLESPAILALSRQLLHAPIFPGRESFDK